MAKKDLKDSLQDLRLSTLERKSDVKDYEHDAKDKAQQQRIDELEKKLSSTRKSLLAITVLSLLAFISGLLNIIL